MTAAHRARGKGQQHAMTMPATRQQADAVQVDVDNSAAEAVAVTAKSELGSSFKKAESGSLDSHLQLRPPTAPEQRWQAVADAAGFDLASGMYEEVMQQPLTLLPNKLATQLADSNAALHSQQDLQLKELLSFAQDELTTSAESTPAASPRPVSHAVEVVPKLRAKIAVSSPGVSARPTPRLNDAEVVQGLLNPARFSHGTQVGSCVGQRLAQLTAKQTAQSTDIDQHRADARKVCFARHSLD